MSSILTLQIQNPVLTTEREITEAHSSVTPSVYISYTPVHFPYSRVHTPSSFRPPLVLGHPLLVVMPLHNIAAHF